MALPPSFSRGSPLQNLLRGHVLHQLVAIHEVRRRSFALAEKLIRLIVPVAAGFVIAFTERDDSPRLRRIAHHYDLCRSLPPGAYHFFSYRVEADRPRRGHGHVV